MNVQAGQPATWPSTSGYTSRRIPAVESTNPPRSRRVAFGARDSVISRVAAISAAMPIGRFTRKIHRHDPPVMSLRMIRPPTSGPVIVAMPITAPTKPNTRARSCGGKVTWITESTCGYIIAAIAALEHAREVEHDRALGEPAQCRRDDEPRHADDEQLLSAKDVTKSAAGDEQHRVGETVAGDDELDVGVVRRRGSSGWPGSRRSRWRRRAAP